MYKSIRNELKVTGASGEAGDPCTSLEHVCVAGDCKSVSGFRPEAPAPEQGELNEELELEVLVILIVAIKACRNSIGCQAGSRERLPTSARNESH